MVITCNDKEIANVVLSESTCDDGEWTTTWNRDVEKITFLAYDTASAYYRAGK